MENKDKGMCKIHLDTILCKRSEEYKIERTCPVCGQKREHRYGEKKKYQTMIDNPVIGN